MKFQWLSITSLCVCIYDCHHSSPASQNHSNIPSTSLSIFPTCPLPSCCQTSFHSLFWWLILSDSMCKWNHTVGIFLFLAYFTEHKHFQIHPPSILSQRAQFPLLKWQNSSPQMYKFQSLYPVVSWFPFGLILHWATVIVATLNLGVKTLSN